MSLQIDACCTLPAPQQHDALLKVLAYLKSETYEFVTLTPASHARVIGRDAFGDARNLRDIFGWSLPFERQALPGDLFAVLKAADALKANPDGRFTSHYRVSSLAGELLLHSAYPAVAENAVFLGPDSYRFASFVEGELSRNTPPPGARLADIGTGAGAGAIAAAKAVPGLQVIMTDINPNALELASVNARAAGVEAESALGAYLDPISAPLDIVITNPPFMIDSRKLSYRAGGEMHGAQITINIAKAAIAKLSPGGHLYLYSGSAIVDGEDRLQQALHELARQRGCSFRYREIDPDIFGEELVQPQYRSVDRIAAVGAVLTIGER